MQLLNSLFLNKKMSFPSKRPRCLTPTSDCSESDSDVEKKPVEKPVEESEEEPVGELEEESEEEPVEEPIVESTDEFKSLYTYVSISNVIDGVIKTKDLKGSRIQYGAFDRWDFNVNTYSGFYKCVCGERKLPVDKKVKSPLQIIRAICEISKYGTFDGTEIPLRVAIERESGETIMIVNDAIMAN